MTKETTICANATTLQLRCYFPSLCWKAVFAGTVAAIGIHLLLTTLGVGAGLASFSSQSTAPHVTDGAALIWSVCALVALFIGGIIAGRFSHTVHGGFVHGVLVWSLTLIITVALLSMGAGMVLGGALKAAGAGGLMAGQASLAGANDGPRQSRDQLGSFIEEATQSAPTNATPKAAIRIKREVGFALTKLFVTGGETNWDSNRTAAIKALADTTQMSEADATRNVDEWIASYRNLKAEIQQQADLAAKNLARAGVWSFFALLIGLLVAAMGGSLGARCAVRHAINAAETDPVRPQTLG